MIEIGGVNSAFNLQDGCVTTFSYCTTTEVMGGEPFFFFFFLYVCVCRRRESSVCVCEREGSMRTGRGRERALKKRQMVWQMVCVRVCRRRESSVCV